MGGGQRRKNRVFAPVTMKMIHEASPRPDDVCEIEGEAINDVSTLILTFEDHYRRPCDCQVGGANANFV